MSSTTTRAIARKACIVNCTARKLGDHYREPVSIRSVQQIFRSTANLYYKNTLVFARLIEKHKVARINQACELVRFSDEEQKKLFWRTINGLVPMDLMDIYLISKICEQISDFDSRRQAGDRSIILWAAFSDRGLVAATVVNAIMNFKDYIGLMQEIIVQITAVKKPNRWILQQNNATIHVAKKTKVFLSEPNVNILNCPRLLTDINPI